MARHLGVVPQVAGQTGPPSCSHQHLAGPVPGRGAASSLDRLVRHPRPVCRSLRHHGSEVASYKEEFWLQHVSTGGATGGYCCQKLSIKIYLSLVLRSSQHLYAFLRDYYWVAFQDYENGAQTFIS